VGISFRDAAAHGIPSEVERLVKSSFYYIFIQCIAKWCTWTLDQTQERTSAGDPLSPFLFILAIDTLQFIFQKAIDEGLLSPLRERTTRIRLSLYVDDAALFLNPTKADVEMTIQIMHMFRMASGLKINTGKSSVVPIRCQEIDTDDVLQCLDGSRAAFPINYLGLPFTTRRLRIAHLQLILDKAAMRMSGWQGNLMNIGGRRELVKTVLSALPTYLLTAIKPPKKLYKDLDKLRRKFLLARNLRLHGGKCKVSWPKVYRPLNRGGLGIHNLDLFGTSL
jgi:hypothetical protein